MSESRSEMCAELQIKPIQKPSPMLVLVLVCMARVLDFLLRLGIAPFFPEVAGRFDISYTAVGVLYSAFFVGYAGLQIPFGWAADRWPAPRMIVPGLVLLGSSALYYVYAPTWLWALVARIGMGAAVAAIAAPAVRMLAQTFAAQQRARALAITEMTVGASVLAALSGLPMLAPYVPPDQVTLILGTACLPLAVVIGWLLRNQPAPPPRVSGPKFVARSELRQVSGLLLTGFIGLFATQGFYGWVPTFLREGQGYGPAMAAAIMAAVMALNLPAAYSAGIVSDRLGRRLPVINAGTTIMLCAYLLLALSVDGPRWLVITAVLIFAVGAGWNMTPLLTFATEALGIARAGLATSLVQTAGQLGSAVVGFIYGALVDLTGGFAAAWWLAAALLAARLGATRLTYEGPTASPGAPSSTPMRPRSAG